MIDGVAQFLRLQEKAESQDPANKLRREDWRELDRISDQFIREYIKLAGCLATTLGNADKKPVSQGIGKKNKGVIVVCDGSSQIKETTLIKALVALCPALRALEDCGDGQGMVKGIWLVGDTKQSRDILFQQITLGIQSSVRSLTIRAPRSERSQVVHPEHELSDSCVHY